MYEFELANGLKLLVREDHRAPVVVSQVWYKVGSSYEHGGITGISHMLEHMMFKGTQSLGPGEFSRIIAKHGGEDNAFTSNDYTAYYQRLEKSLLETSFRLEADRMNNLLLRKEDLETERQVVMEERRLRTEDRPQNLAYEHFRATAFQNNPYQNPVIGWMADIASYSIEDLRDWYAKWYAPNNATVVVVGDVSPDEVLALAKKHFARLPPRPLGVVKPRSEVEQLGPKRVTIQRPARVPYLLMGYKVPSLATASPAWEAYALVVLAAILDGNDSARLSRELIRGDAIAASASASYDPYDRLTTLFTFSGIPVQGHTLERLERAFRDQVARVQDAQVKVRELERVKGQVVAEQTYARDSVFYQAMQMGALETVGLGWERVEEFVERIQAVTAEQVQAVARKYLVENSLTVAALEPQRQMVATMPATGSNKGAAGAQ